jgi:hypothetical protein
MVYCLVVKKSGSSLRFGVIDLLKLTGVLCHAGAAFVELMSKVFPQSRLQAMFRNIYSHYNDLVCQYNLPLGQMLSYVFHTNY